MRQGIPRPLVAMVVSMLLVGAVNALGGCAYIDAQLQRTAPPDTRIKLGWQDRVFVDPRDVAEYTCRDGRILICDRGGAITYSCTCLSP